ncbi:protein-export chaperone SecB [Alphaproteobacteria bacterium]|nr:protein-export chaperone SecB [Alphaproteobacteria bacterium]
MTNNENNSNEIEFGVISQYLKDASFENPQAPSIFNKNLKPKIDIGFDIKAKNLSENQHEVSLQIKVQSEQDSKMVFLLDITYAGLFKVSNNFESKKEYITLVECPKFLFPYARQIVSEMIKDGGYPPLMIDPVDFDRLYKSKYN